ncbi:hypothetical protein NMG60_11001487 [Bertholletia excelsa]
MADLMVIDIEESEKKKPETDNPDRENSAKKLLKRKRASLLESLGREEREARISDLREELECLYKFYRELLNEKVNLELSECASNNLMIACFLEESNLPLSKLVGEIYEKMKAREGSITVASVKSSVLFIGQRSLYGVANADADVLEDEAESCLWCWETRDIKLMPKSVRGTLKNRRTWRRKIHERITAVSEMINALQEPENNQDHRFDIAKASERLGKVLGEADIRLLVKSMEQKNGAIIAEKEAKREEKLLIKQLERNKRESEKEKKRLDRQLQKEKWQKEKEIKRLHDEAEKEERRREKEESELRKQLRKQQEEAEKEQRRKEKEDAELKKQLSLQKQASLMERFVKRSKNTPTSSNDPSVKAKVSDLSPSKSENVSKSVTLLMDSSLSKKDDIKLEDIRKSHLVSWRAIRSNRKQHWGIRRNPKTKVVKEIKLSSSRGLARDDYSIMDRVPDGWNGTKVEGRSCDINDDSAVSSSQRHCQSKQLLQFDKSYRPAFYGIWPKKSQVIGPRHPLKKDPDLDYDIDSDEEWEEEEPGESLSDCDKDDEEDILEEGCSKADEEDDSEDGFFVPDGYLSDNEGVQVDRMDSNCLVDEVRSSPGHKPESDSEEIRIFFRQQKYLHNLTEHALQKNQPLIVLNLMHEKASLLTSEELTGTAKVEQMCLQALSMRVFPGVLPIDISIDDNCQEENQGTTTSCGKDCTTPAGTTVLDSDLPQIVSTIQSCSQGLNKLVESLHLKFPSVSKSVLRNKVREISDYVDNRWQVKKDILDKLGLSISPEKVGGRRKTIVSFFSKKVSAPGNGKTINHTETSPQSSQKTSPASITSSANS